MKKVLFVSLSLLLAVIVLACAKPAPAPVPSPAAPAPAPKVSPAPAAKPSPAAVAKPAAPTAAPKASPAAAPRRVDIKLLTAKLGSGGYVLGAGWAELINKNSSWLRATVVETAGCVDDIKYGYDDPKERAYDLRWMIESQTQLAWNGKPPYTQKYTGHKVIMFGYAGFNSVFTIDPKIQSYKDLIGKKVATGARGSSLQETGEFILKDCWNIIDKVNVVYLSFGEAKDALMDGTISAMCGTVTLTAPGQWKIHESLTEPWETKAGAHFVSPTKEEVERAVKEKGHPYGYLSCAKGSMGPKQTAEVGGQSYHMYWGAYSEMPDDVAYEIARIAYEQSSQIGNYMAAGKSFTRDTMAWFPDIHKTEAEVHPGALKLYKEKGVKMYLGGAKPTNL